MKVFSSKCHLKLKFYEMPHFSGKLTTIGTGTVTDSKKINFDLSPMVV